MVTITLVVLAAFGPYVGGGIRTEQLAVYVLALGAFLIEYRRVRISGAAMAAMGCYVLVLAVAVLGAAFPPMMSGYSYNFGRALLGRTRLSAPSTGRCS